MYGEGKGKTCSAIGQTMRMIGHGNRAMFCQFLKNGTSGEVDILIKHPKIQYLCPQEYLSAESNKELFDWVVHLTKMKYYDIIILDEILDTIDGGTVSEFDLGRMISLCNDSHTELIITGHNEPDKRIIQLCDYVTYFTKIKHPYDLGIKTREGIEF